MLATAKINCYTAIDNQVQGSSLGEPAEHGLIPALIASSGAPPG